MSAIRVYKAHEVSQVIDRNKELLLVHFGSPLASACEFVRQELGMLAPCFDGTPVSFAEVELPLQDFELIQTYSIEEVPTLVLFQGSKEVERLEKILLPEELKDFLEAATSFYTAPAAPLGEAASGSDR